MSDRSLLSTTNSGEGRTETLIRPGRLSQGRVPGRLSQRQGRASRNSNITLRPDPGDSHYTDPGGVPGRLSHRQGRGPWSSFTSARKGGRGRLSHRPTCMKELVRGDSHTAHAGPKFKKTKGKVETRGNRKISKD